MKIKLVLQCRGRGKLYAQVLLSGVDKENLKLSVVGSDGGELPFLFFPEWAPDGRCSGILVLFLTKTTQFVRAVDVESGKTSVLAFHPLVAAFSSKKNGALHRLECGRIRDYDALECRKHESLTVDYAIPDEGSWIVRGIAKIAGKKNPDITVFDFSGKAINYGTILLFDTLGRDSASRDVLYSTRIPFASSGQMCVCLRSGTEEGGWTCLTAVESDEWKGLREDSVRRFRTAFDDPRYDRWLSSRLLTESGRLFQQAQKFDIEPTFSVIVPLFKTPPDLFREMADSVLSQSYGGWELLLVNASPDQLYLSDLVREYRERDDRVRVVNLDGNYGITENTNYGIAAAKGDYLCFFDHDDVLEPDILFEYVKVINEDPDVDLLYCDEDKLFPDGTYGHPSFKPDFSIDLLRDNNYICHLLTVRKSTYSLVDASSGELDGAQDHAMVLKIAERGGKIRHVPKILYHWRMTQQSTALNAGSKPYATQAGILAVQQHLDRLGIKASVSCSHGRDFRYRTIYQLPEDISVSLVISLREGQDSFFNLKATIDAVNDLVDEVIFIVREGEAPKVRRFDWGFAEESWKILELPRDASSSPCARNEGARLAEGDYLVFLDGDFYSKPGDWLSELLGICCRDDVGVVGPMLCNEDDTVLQAGLAVVGGDVVPLSRDIPSKSPGYIFRPLSTQNVSAVGGACLLTKRACFDRCGGFDELYQTAYSDVDYCFRARQDDLLVVYSPESKLYHSSGTSCFGNNEKCGAAHYADKARFLGKWAEVLADGDPYFSPNFSKNPAEAAVYALGF